MRVKFLVSLGLALSLLFGTTACGSDGEEDAADQGEEQTSAPEPDLEGIPEVVAVVDGQEISKAAFIETYELQFQQLSAQAQTSGEAPDQDELKKQTVESMIGTQLLLQESDKRGLEASTEDVDAEIDELVEQNGLESAEEFFAAVEQQGTDEATARSQLEQQVKLDQLLVEESANTEPTDEEVEQLYEQLTAQQEEAGGADGGSEIPSLDDVRPELEEQVKNQKESEAANTLIGELREGADVTINL